MSGGPGRGADDLAAVAAGFGAALRGAGVPAGPGNCERFARAVMLVRPATTHALYLCALATLVSGQAQIEVLRQVFDATFGSLPSMADPAGQRGDQDAPGLPRAQTRSAHDDMLAQAARTARTHTHAMRVGDREPSPTQEETPDQEAGRPAVASPAERLASRDFAELSPAELRLLTDLMRRLTLSVPLRRSRRQRRTPHGRRTDLRATLRQARRTGGDPFRLIRRSPTRHPRRLVVLCDISGSMEPYARAMLQLLYCAAGGARAEVFTFATRLTRLTSAFTHSRPGQALERAGLAAPDWSGGTRIGASLREFNDSYGRRGLARGAVIVVISDGWDTGDAAVLRREMERLSLVAFRIVWVNPRTQSPDYRPLAAGMAAAWPYCDAVVSAHSLRALDELTTALADPVRRRPVPAA